MSRSVVASRSMYRTRVAALAACALTLALAACGSSNDSNSGGSASGSNAPLSAPKVSLGIADTAEGGLMIRVAADQGYWTQLGLTVDIQVVPTGPAQLAGIAGGSLQLCQSGPSTTMVPIQNGKAKVKFIAATQTAVPWQLVISKSWAAGHGITSSTDLEEIVPKMKGATFAGVTNAVDSIGTVQGYTLTQYGVTDVKTNYLGSPAAMFAALTAGRADGYIDVLGQSFQAAQQNGAIIVDLADLKKLPLISSSIPSFFTVGESFAAEHPDTLKAFLIGMWKAWMYIKDPAHHDALVSYIQKQYPGTPNEAANYFIKFSADKGMWMSEELWKNTVDLANTTLKPPLTVTYTQVADPQFQKAAVESLGIKPPHYDG